MQIHSKKSKKRVVKKAVPVVTTLAYVQRPNLTAVMKKLEQLHTDIQLLIGRFVVPTPVYAAELIPATKLSGVGDTQLVLPMIESKEFRHHNQEKKNDL